MYWQDKEADQSSDISDNVVDVVFAVECKILPVDHAHELYLAIKERLPWIKGQALAGIHPIHVADSGNGWQRPENPDDLLYLSERTKLELRLPKEKLDAANELVGQTLMISGNSMLIKAASTRRLSPLTTLLSRHIVIAAEESEDKFLDRIVAEMKQLGLNPKRVLPGKSNRIRTPEAELKTHSLLVSDLGQQESILLQQQGLGQHRHLGCGLFIPHKEVVDLREMTKQDAL